MTGSSKVTVCHIRDQSFAAATTRKLGHPQVHVAAMRVKPSALLNMVDEPYRTLKQVHTDLSFIYTYVRNISMHALI